jgi:hypothetical protein
VRATSRAAAPPSSTVLCAGSSANQGAVGLVPQHGRGTRAQQVPDLLGDHREHPLRRLAAGHPGGHPAQRGLLAGGAAAPGDVAGGGADQALLRDRPGAPLEPALGAVRAQVAVLELGHLDPARQPCDRRAGSGAST